MEQRQKDFLEIILNDIINRHNNSDRLSIMKIKPLFVEYNKYVKNKSRKYIKTYKTKDVKYEEREKTPVYRPIEKENKYIPYKFS